VGGFEKTEACLTDVGAKRDQSQ